MIVQVKLLLVVRPNLTIMIVYALFCTRSFTISFRLRHMRKKDREINSSVYPRLNYPEVYLLEGGYKTFFNTNTVRLQSLNTWSVTLICILKCNKIHVLKQSSVLKWKYSQVCCFFRQTFTRLKHFCRFKNVFFYNLR